MIKVEHTKLYHANVLDSIHKLVTEAKLVLVYNPDKFNSSWNYKPILISRTEKIEDDDWYYDELTKLILKKSGWVNKEQTVHFSKSGTTTPIQCAFKILALPEHFSPEQLQMIVDGKLKDGDKVLVECERYGSPAIELDDKGNQIKLNPHITIMIEDDVNPTIKELILNKAENPRIYDNYMDFEIGVDATLAFLGIDGYLNKNNLNLIHELKKVIGAIEYDGEASCQVLLPTKGKKYLRIGITDEDVGTGQLWFDYYEGFNNEISRLQNTVEEKMYTREEVFNIIFNVREFYHSNSSYPAGEMIEKLKEWFEENVK